jgi:recombination protein RecT
MSDQHTQLVSLRDKVQNVRDLLEKNKAQIAMALPRHMTADRMLRVAMTAVQRTPKLLECTPNSLFGAVVQASQLGLEPDGALGHAYLIPYWNGKKKCFEVQFMPGYKGLLDLARRSREISTIEARVVHANDAFRYRFGLSPILEHTPITTGESGSATHVYAVVHLKDGGAQFDVMSREDVEKIRARAQAKDSGPWVTDWDEMAKKTILRRLCKLLPSSIELQRAVALDEAIEAGIPQMFDVTPLPVEVATSQPSAGDETDAQIDAELAGEDGTEKRS